MFNGSPDRYNWKLVGRREMYVPYNSYKLHKGGLSIDDIIQPLHMKPELLRYELHRVWEVEATLKKPSGHKYYARRTFYLDEDSWQILAIDHYDHSGDLYRVAEAHVINYYEVPLLFQTVEVIYDLKNNNYLALGINNEMIPEKFNHEMSCLDFTSNTLRQEGIQ